MRFRPSIRKRLAAAAFLGATLVVACSGSRSAPSGVEARGFLPLAPAAKSKIQHIVIIVQENRTFDNFFDCFPGTDCVKTAPPPDPQPSPGSSGSPCPGPVPTPSPGKSPKPIKLKFGASLRGLDVDHSYCPAFLTEYDNGKLDGFYWVTDIAPGVPAGKYPYQVVAQKQIQPYWDMATQYVLGDRMFPTQASGSFTAHQDLIRGDTIVTSDAAVVDYPWNPGGVDFWGCDDAKNPPKGPSVTSLLTFEKEYLYNQGPFPCFEYETIRDLLDTAGVSWKYYAPTFGKNDGQEWNAFDAVSAVRYDKGEWPNKGVFNCTGSCVSWPETNVLCDAQNSTASPCPKPKSGGGVSLPSLSWVIPDGIDSDHGYGYKPPGEDNGPDWVATVVNTIGQSKYWNSTAIIVTWDDWGGLYDHIPPPQLDFEGLGMRVPLIVISPYAKKGYVSHVQYEFGSFLKFAENTFGLPSLGTTDVRANDLTDAFDFTQSPRKFVAIKLIKKNHDRAYFLRRPPSNTPVDTQ